jgi:hypothetical protein
MAIWQDLVSQYGFDRGYQSVNRFGHKLRPCQPLQAGPVITTAPGEEAQVDYGTGPMVRDPQSNKYRRTRLFVMTLGFSRKSVRLLVFCSRSRLWAELHEKAFRRPGGSVRIGSVGFEVTTEDSVASSTSCNRLILFGETSETTLFVILLFLNMNLFCSIILRLVENLIQE